jgi:hypothetical protein
LFYRGETATTRKILSTESAVKLQNDLVRKAELLEKLFLDSGNFVEVLQFRQLAVARSERMFFSLSYYFIMVVDYITLLTLASEGSSFERIFEPFRKICA